ALMQHHGCSTRLIDFTTNPLIALFFASDPSEKADGEVIVLTYKRVNEKIDSGELFTHPRDFVYQPPHITDRIVGQSGCFVYSHLPNRELDGLKSIERISIKNSEKSEIREELSYLGVNYTNIFPGLDGICRDLNDVLINDLELDAIFNML